MQRKMQLEFIAELNQQQLANGDRVRSTVIVKAFHKKVYIKVVDPRNLDLRQK